MPEFPAYGLAPGSADGQVPVWDAASGSWQLAPADVAAAKAWGFQAWNFDPALIGSTLSVSTAQGFALLMHVTPGEILHGIWCCIDTAGATLTAGENLGYLYDGTYGRSTSGLLLAQTADLTTWAESVEDTPTTAYNAFTATCVAPASGLVYAGFVFSGGSVPKLGSATAAAGGGAGLTDASGLYRGLLRTFAAFPEPNMSGWTNEVASFAGVWVALS